MVPREKCRGTSGEVWELPGNLGIALKIHSENFWGGRRGTSGEFWEVQGALGKSDSLPATSQNGLQLRAIWVLRWDIAYNLRLQVLVFVELDHELRL